MENDRIDEIEHTIADLMRTPVGRRWLLKAGFTAAAAAGLPAWAGAAARPDVTVIDRLGAAAKIPQSVVFHLALGPAAGLADLTLLANGSKVRLTAHTRSTRSALSSRGTVWRKMNTSTLTHFATVRLPRHRAFIITVRGVRNGKMVLVAEAFYPPAWATRALAQAAFKLERSFRSTAPCSERLAALGLSASQLTSPDEIVTLQQVLDTQQTAVSLVMKHPSVGNVAPIENATTNALLSATPEVCTLGTYIGQMQQNGVDYASYENVVDRSGQQSQITVGGKTVPLQTVQLNRTDQTFQNTARDALVAGVLGVRDTGPLGKVIDRPIDAIHDTQDSSSWHQPQGLVITPTQYVPPTGVGAGVQVQQQNPGLFHGTEIDINGPLSGTQLPLTIYNDFVRWVWVYVQYLNAAGTNLSISPGGASFPHTKYSRSLGMLPQVFTFVGIPLFNTNTIHVTLDFPSEATAARVLICGLGANADGGGWRQYFPADAYPGHIAPQDEVLFPALMTGIVSIALTAFALLTDLDIATTWAAIREIPEDNVEAFEDLLVALVQGNPLLTATDVFATTVAGGAATYEDIANNHGDPSNIWNTILSTLGSIIPKILFQPCAATAVGESSPPSSSVTRPWTRLSRPSRSSGRSSWPSRRSAMP